MKESQIKNSWVDQVSAMKSYGTLLEVLSVQLGDGRLTLDWLGNTVSVAVDLS